MIWSAVNFSSRGIYRPFLVVTALGLSTAARYREPIESMGSTYRSSRPMIKSIPEKMPFLCLLETSPVRLSGSD